MPHEVKPLACDPRRIKGMSEKLLVSHHENNYCGAVRRLNAITEQLAALDFASAPVFVVNGLKREELIAMNSMILHELFFASLGDSGEPDGALRDALVRDFGSLTRWSAEFSAMGWSNVQVTEQGRYLEIAASKEGQSRKMMVDTLTGHLIVDEDDD
jgi:Fe-Mn family superoxide dismutase